MSLSTRLLFLAVLAALGIVAAGCSTAPLPPLFATVPAAPSGQPVGPAPQPAVAPAAEAPVAAAAVVSPGQAITVTALITPEIEPTAVVVAAVPPTATPKPTPTAGPTATSGPVEPTAAPVTSKQTEVKPTQVAVRAPQSATPTRLPARPTATRVKPTATRAPARPTPTRVQPTPTPEWPRTLTITEQQLEQQAGSVPGLQVTGLDVTFADNSMILSADSLRYSIVSIRDLTVQGHFTASNCDVAFVADRIQPRNLATSAIPNLVNQTLDQQLGQWCVETIAITPGQLVATVRPR